MKTYKVTCVQRMERIIEIEASSIKEAVSKAEDAIKGTTQIVSAVDDRLLNCNGRCSRCGGPVFFSFEQRGIPENMCPECWAKVQEAMKSLDQVPA